MPDAEVKSIHIKNPRVIDKATQAHEKGYGRSITEAAENLILEGAEKLDRDAAHGDPRSSEQASAA